MPTLVIEPSQEELTMPTDMKNTLVQMFYSGQDQPFICGAYGNVSMLDDIEKEWLGDEELEDDQIFKEAGNYLFECFWEPPQIGEFGMVELAGYWNLELRLFKPLPDDT